MLLALQIRDFVTIESLDLEFGAGFTALTGETGAGKSILIDALALTLGERADPALIRTGSARAEITAEFAIETSAVVAAWIETQGLEGDPGRLLVRRLVDAGGKSRAFINGHAATLAQLREVGDWLVDIHGQHEHQSLTRADAQRKLLDTHAGLTGLVEEVGAAYREWRGLARLLAEHEQNAAVREAEREQLAWQVEEIARLALQEGELELLGQEQARLSHAASLIEGAQSAIEGLAEAEASALDRVSSTAARLRALCQYDTSLEVPVTALEAATAQISEAVHSLRRYVARMDLDPGRLREVDDRLQAVHSLARRYRVRAGELTALLQEKRARLAELNAASDLETLSKREQASGAMYRDLAGRLSGERRKAAARLGRDVTAALKELSMSGSRFDVRLRPVPDGSLHGDETVDFCIAANAGGEARPLGRAASGGELSRISLAIQVITSRAAAVPTLIFDEVDAGIGGAVAEVVGRKLQALGHDRQVLCVTHLPQVAARAGTQWNVSKHGDGTAGVVRTRATLLDTRARIEELARMLGGIEITATTRKHAAEMLRSK